MCGDAFSAMTEQTRTDLAMFSETSSAMPNLMPNGRPTGSATGVMTTDNMSILGITFDSARSPFLMTRRQLHLQPLDDQRRYSFQQSSAHGQWNLRDLASVTPSSA